MTNKKFAITGFLAPIIFWVTYFIISNKRTEYSFLTKAISELGSIDVPNRWVWNVFGYILPGLLITIYSFGLYRNIKSEQSGKLPFWGIFMSGIFMAISGFFPGDFVERNSASMLIHTMGSIGSYLFFLFSAFTYPRHMKENMYWKKAIKPTLFFTWMTIVFGSWTFIFPKFPGVGQRIVFAFFFLWIMYTAVKLYFSPSDRPY